MMKEAGPSLDQKGKDGQVVHPGLTLRPNPAPCATEQRDATIGSEAGLGVAGYAQFFLLNPSSPYGMVVTVNVCQEGVE